MKVMSAHMHVGTDMSSSAWTDTGHIRLLEISCRN